MVFDPASGRLVNKTVRREMTKDEIEWIMRYHPIGS